MGAGIPVPRIYPSRPRSLAILTPTITLPGTMDTLILPLLLLIFGLNRHLVFENIALRRQLAILRRQTKRPRIRPRMAWWSRCRVSPGCIIRMVARSCVTGRRRPVGSCCIRHSCAPWRGPTGLPLGGTRIPGLPHLADPGIYCRLM